MGDKGKLVLNAAVLGVGGAQTGFVTSKVGAQSSSFLRASAILSGAAVLTGALVYNQESALAEGSALDEYLDPEKVI